MDTEVRLLAFNVAEAGLEYILTLAIMPNERKRLNEARAIVLRLKTLEEEQ
ncbi:hypothetical protein LCGC14_2346620 [marine sediment metagenome]|uniref:Uncharacterized protein n=1 Tax=marine sediment metagenome TaxID=412755 RepID=A0A0F9CAD7_9ZZZZ